MSKETPAEGHRATSHVERQREATRRGIEALARKIVERRKAEAAEDPLSEESEG